MSREPHGSTLVGPDRGRTERAIDAYVVRQAVLIRLGQRALSAADLDAFLDEATETLATTLGVEYAAIVPYSS